jgi:hypothetical protein
MRCRLVSLVVIVAALAASTCRAGTVYLARASDAFGTLDLATGTFHQIGKTSVELSAMTFAPNGTLFAIGQDNALYQVNVATAALTKVGTTGSFFPMIGLAARSDGALFGTDAFTSGPGGDEYRVNATTGAATILGQAGLSSGFAANGGLAFGPGDNLYLDYGLFASDYALYKVDQTTGVATKVGNTGVSAGAFVITGGQGYGFDFFGEIYRYDLATGAGTDTHVAVLGNFDSIEAAAAFDGTPPTSTPEPASLTLIAVSAAGLMAYQWRRAQKPA